MNLSHSHYLVQCPDLSGASSLKTLIFYGCIRLQELHPSICKMTKLAFLSVRGCNMVRYMPAIFRLESLGVVNLSSYSMLEKLPEIQVNMKNLLELNLEGIAIVELPSLVEYLP